MLPNCVLGTPLIRQRLPPNAPEVLWEELWPDRYWETPQGLRMLLGAFRGGNPLERIVWFWEVCRPDLVTPVTRRSRKPLGRVVGMSSKCCGEISPQKSASVYECVRSCRYAAFSEYHLMRTGLPRS